MCSEGCRLFGPEPVLEYRRKLSAGCVGDVPFYQQKADEDYIAVQRTSYWLLSHSRR